MNIMINAIGKQFDSNTIKIKISLHLHLAFIDVVNLHFHPPWNAAFRNKRT